ncbi:hypothetical protein D3C75_961530 [compost metagenome]
MDADRDLIIKGVADLVNVPDFWRHRFNLARPQLHTATVGDQGTVAVALETLRILRAAQHANQPPDPMVMDRCALPRPPDKTDDTEPLP